MNKILKSLSVMALFLGVGISANAQQGAQEGVVVTARILKQITFTAEDTIRFGTISAGGGQTYLNPQSQATSQNVGFSARVGRLVIDASAEETIRVNFDPTVIMERVPATSGTGADSITFQPLISVIHENKQITDADRTASVLISDQPIADLVTDVTGPGGTGEGPYGLITTSNVDEKTTLYIGGRLYLVNTQNPIPSNGPTGTFRGTLNFNVLYEGL